MIDQILFIFRYGLVGDQEYNITTLAYVFRYTTTSIKETLKEMLNHYKNILSDLKPNEISNKLLRALIKERKD